jgi:hypothetical protein
MGKVAQGLCVTSGTATTMIKNLAGSGWLNYYPRRGVRLTRKGKKLAMNMLRRHRLLETFLVETLGLDWSENPSGSRGIGACHIGKKFWRNWMSFWVVPGRTPTVIQYQREVELSEEPVPKAS